jgi:hypothetical protein
MAEAAACDLEPSQSRPEPQAMDVNREEFQEESPWEISDPQNQKKRRRTMGYGNQTRYV